MVCANCGSESHHTGSSTCQSYCTMCAQPGHRQQRGTCPYRVCNTCGETGHSARECNPRCKACGSSDHRNSSSFACPEHKCSKCKGALDPKGHNKNNCPGSAVCEACGSSDHRNAKSFECPEHKCSKCKGVLTTMAHAIQISHTIRITKVRAARFAHTLLVASVKHKLLPRSR